MVAEYGGETLKVVGSVAHGENDYIVRAQVIDPSDAANKSPAEEVEIRMLCENGRFVVVDASVEGVWLGLAQHDDFTSFLDQRNGDIAALTERVRQLTDKLQATAPSASTK